MPAKLWDERGYALFREALRRSGKVAVASVVRVPGTNLKVLRTSDRNLKMAERLVAEMAEDWDPEEYHDKFDIYGRKRDFARTPEPKGRTRGAAERRSFVVQRHAARRLHYDFRLELDGVLKSWAVPKQPAPVPGQKRLAVHVEDHPLEYGSFIKEHDAPAREKPRAR